jgi:transcriptional regulator with XRE-family HTH domain
MNKIETKLGDASVFSKNLVRYIERSDKTQRELARVVGVSPSTICDWTRGRAYPRMDKLQKLADYFGISKSELVEDNYVAKETVSGKEQKLLDLFHKVPEEHRDGLLELIEVYSKNLR